MSRYKNGYLLLIRDYRRLKQGRQPESFKIKRRKSKKSGFIFRKRVISNLRRRIAMNLYLPLQQRKDYYHVYRRAFLINPLPHGALPNYEKDFIL